MKTKVWLIIAASFVLLGCILFAGVMTMLKWDFTKLSTVEYENNTYVVTEAFNSISIDTKTADIVFALSDDGKSRVECYEEEKAKHSVTVEDGTLTIELIDERSAYDFIGNVGLNLDTPKVTVYLPKTEYVSLVVKESTGDIEIPEDFIFEDINISSSTGDVKLFSSASGLIKIKTSTGNVNVENVSANKLDLKLSTGKVRLTNVECESIVSSASTGDILLNRVIATERISIKRSTGDVKFENSDAKEIFIETDTGNVIGNLLTEKVFVAKSDTGKTDVPKTVTGGRCEITTDTGNIKIECGVIH